MNLSKKQLLNEKILKKVKKIYLYFSYKILCLLYCIYIIDKKVNKLFLNILLINFNNQINFLILKKR